MKTFADPDRLLGDGLASLRERFAIPEGFPPEVLAEAERTAGEAVDARADRTDRPFVTLDPASATDLDQAFTIEKSGAELLLHYALADIGWYVPIGGAMEAEAWRRGLTYYLPDGKARLYPPILSENAASLLPDGPRPAIIVTVRCSADGSLALESVERAVVRSRAKLAYESVDLADLPHLAEFAARMRQGEDSRGAARVDPPEQEIERGEDGRYRLHLRAWAPSETANSALSLAANIAIAQALQAAGTGLFREMAPPDERAIRRLRQTARGLGLNWPEPMSLSEFERGIDARSVAGASFQLAVRRVTGGADYVPYREGHRPFHAAIGAIYCHATAPMRRLADRYVLEAVLALFEGTPRGAGEAERFARLAETMNAADARESAIERAVLDLAEAALLHGREGDVFRAIVTERDEKGARLQLCDFPVIARVDTRSIAAGDEVQVRLLSADPLRGAVRFERVR
jgi:exoribonuclease R